MTKNNHKLPDGWQWVRLGDVCEINPRRTSDIKKDDKTLTTFVPMSAVDGRLGIIAEAELKPYFEVKRGYTYFEEGDVLFAKITPCMENGKNAIANNLIDGFGFGTTEFHVIRPNEFIDAIYIHNFIRQPKIYQLATEHFTGSVGQQS